MLAKLIRVSQGLLATTLNQLITQFLLFLNKYKVLPKSKLNMQNLILL
jgi:hypothetical protein